VENFISLAQVNELQRAQYSQAIREAFPQIISESPIIKINWHKLEQYFPKFQQFLIASNGQLIGFINSIPFRFDNELIDLPDRGWDWMFEKGVDDVENNLSPNYLGGLQIIVRKEYQSQGYSKKILNHAKSLIVSSNLNKLIIPIRPTRKNEFPEMTMSNYMKLEKDGKVFDPWIRTHLKSGADIIKVCNQSMIMTGDIKFWEVMIKRKLPKSGRYRLEGGLNLVNIDVENNMGSYIEPNIWIKYD